jgi:hypothetical protein
MFRDFHSLIKTLGHSPCQLLFTKNLIQHWMSSERRQIDQNRARDGESQKQAIFNYTSFLEGSKNHRKSTPTLSSVLPNISFFRSPGPKCTISTFDIPALLTTVYNKIQAFFQYYSIFFQTRLFNIMHHYPMKLNNH